MAGCHVGDPNYQQLIMHWWEAHLAKNHGWSSRNGLDGSLSSVAILECSFKISQYLYCSFGNDLLGSDQCSHLCDRLGKESSFLS